MQINIFSKICLKQASVLIYHSITRGQGKKDRHNQSQFCLFDLVFSGAQPLKEKAITKGLFENLFTLKGLGTKFCPAPFLIFSKIVGKKI